ncbi:MAG TPA: FliM/FliN family flagellar motor switch protein [Steroidobacteraceae bacterium]|jgi:flagellar motor switch protein FliN/FliY
MSSKVVSAVELPALIHGSHAPERAQPLGERLDLVEHVKVRMTIVLGAAELQLGRLFAMTAGEVISLDRDVDAPVDVRLHDKLVARGHIVAVGDKFGVRISEILAD